jgi:hypothetical protein
MNYPNSNSYLSKVSIGITAIAIAIVLFSAWPKSPLAAYDFSSPENTLRSLTQMRVNMDVDATSYNHALNAREKYVERLQTVHVSKVVEYGGCKGVCYSYTSEGVPECGVAWFEKDADTGQWHAKPFFSNDNKAFAMVVDWRSQWKLNGQKTGPVN